MKIVVSVQRQPDDNDPSPAAIRQKIKAVAAESVRLLEKWPHMEWMTQTGEISGRASRNSRQST